MKWVIITLIVAATVVLVVFYQPANQVIRRAFEQLTGMQLVPTATWENMEAENAVLEERLDRERDKRIGYQEANELLMDSLSENHKYIASLEADLTDMEQDLEGQQEVFDDMDEIQHIGLFDNLTDAQHITEVSDDGRALVTHDRIKDANWKLHERNYYKQRSQTLTELTGAQQDYIERMGQINANLEAQLSSKRQEKAILRRQYDNCLEAHEDIEKDANRRARAGYAVGLAGLLIGLFL